MESIPKYSFETWQIVSCLACKFVFLANPPSYEQLTSEFAWEKQKKEEVRREKRSPFLTWLDHNTMWRKRASSRSSENRVFKRVFRPGNVLDVGCARGRDLPSDFIPYGIELSEEFYKVAAERMAAKGGRAIHASGADGVWDFDEGFFTGIIIRCVLEHEKEPDKLLNGAHRALAQSGAAFVRVPNYGCLNRKVLGPKWCGFRYPDHVNYFTHETLRRIAAAAGFRTQILNPLNVLDDNIKALLFKA